MAGRGKAGEAWQGRAGQGKARQAWQGWAGWGRAWQGKAGMDKGLIEMKKQQADEQITIKAPAMRIAKFKLRGTAPYVQNAFPEKARELMRSKQAAGSVAKKGSKREAKDFNLCYEQAQHVSREGWNGIPASAFRAALISACRLVGFKMTLAKLSVTVIADGFDRLDGTPLVKITKGKPEYVEHAVRNATGVADIRARPMWSEGWEAEPTIRWDSDQFTAPDVANLLMRVGMQVGIGEGRNDSKNSAGMGWGSFEVLG